MYIPRAGHITHMGQNFDVNRYPLSIWLSVASFSLFGGFFCVCVCFFFFVFFFFFVLFFVVVFFCFFFFFL